MKRLVGTFLFLAIALTGVAQELSDSVICRISGIVRDKASGTRLENVSITIPNTDISTVTNSDGYFLLKLKEKPVAISVSSLGYKTRKVVVRNEVSQNLDIRLTPAAIPLPELIVYQDDPEKLVYGAMMRVRDNYVQTPELHKSFYRETIQKGSRYIDVAEAILTTYRKGYDHGINADRVKIEQGRHIVSQRRKDTLSVKVLGGPTTPIVLDAVKNRDILFDDIVSGCYEFTMEMPDVIDERTQFVISFKPRLVQSWALYNGKFYIDRQTLAFTRMEFSLDVSDQDKATRTMLYKKPSGLRFRPLALTTTVNYRDGRINYMNTEFRFKCDYKKRFFSRTYRCTAEMVVTDVQPNYQGRNIDYKQRFRNNESFNDCVNEFSNPDFWKDYTIIEPTESLEKAIKKLK